MAFKYKLGKKAARHDPRVPRMSIHVPGLPFPPPSANYYADIESWGMLGNDEVGNCVEAAILHIILQESSYAMAPVKPPMPTTAEALTFYERSTGYNPADPSTDQGSYVLGNGGAMEYWLKHGVICGGVLNKPIAFLAITKRNPTQWRQAIATFGNVLFGLNLPQAIVATEETPYLWSDHSGLIAGGHEILLVGYRTTSHGTLYQLVSWGQIYQATEAFLLHCWDEAVTVVDPAFINLAGVNPAGISLVALETAMNTMRNTA